jgi:hypothetical protein
MDVGELSDEGLKKQLADLVAPAEAIFLDAKTEADLGCGNHRLSSEMYFDLRRGQTLDKGRAVAVALSDWCGCQPPAG